MDNLNYDNANRNDDALYLGEPLDAASGERDIAPTDDENTGSSSADDRVRERKHLVTPVLTFQLTVCLLFLTLLFLSKTFIYNVYSEFKAWYDAEYSTTVFFSGKFSDLDFSELFGSTTDEAER